MKILKYPVLLVLICSYATSFADAEFGRFYTTPNQRNQLDESRNKRPQDEIIVDVSRQDLPQARSEESGLVITDSITLDGLVYRSDGKNTAWVNRSSTNEGNIETQFTRVGEDDVRSNHVQITLPGNRTNIELKVGQQYDVNTQQVIDVVKDPATLPTNNRPSR